MFTDKYIRVLLNFVFWTGAKSYMPFLLLKENTVFYITSMTANAWAQLSHHASKQARYMNETKAARRVILQAEPLNILSFIISINILHQE